MTTAKRFARARATILKWRAWLARHSGNERGQYLIQTVILLPLMLFLAGLVIDGGWMYWQYRRAETTVNAAAQAASHAIDVDYFQATNEVQLDPALAYGVASDFVALNQRGQMAVTGISVSPDQIIVDAGGHVDTLFLRIAGIAQLPVRVRGHAYPAFGINTEGQ